MKLTEQQIVDTIRSAIEPLEYVNAMWMGGSHAFGENDEYSDVDVQIDVADDRHEDVFVVLEAALNMQSPITNTLVVPEPAWHGHHQRVYIQRDAPEWLLIDLVIMERNTKSPRLDEREIHGEPVVIFDKLGVIKAVPANKAALRESIRKRIDSMRLRFELLSHFPQKEIERGLYLDALWRYYSAVLNPLVAVLRLKHSPFRHDWGARYLKRDFPVDVYEKLLALSFVANECELEAKVTEAIAWAKREYVAIDADKIDLDSV